jgi:excisionase family DNA binding protein
MKPDEIRKQFALIGECMFRLCNSTPANHPRNLNEPDADDPQAEIKSLLMDIKAQLLRETGISREFLTEKEAATYLGVSPRTIRNWRERRELPVTQLGRAVRYQKSQLDHFAKAHSTPIKPRRSSH